MSIDLLIKSTLQPLSSVKRYLKNRDGTTLTVFAPQTTIGREGCDVNIPHRAVSQKHATLRLEGQTASIEDAGSKNGTFVNGQQLQPHCPVELHPGDVIQISRSQIHQFTFCEEPRRDDGGPDLLAIVRTLNAYLDEKELLAQLLKLAANLVAADRAFILPLDAAEPERCRPLATWPPPAEADSEVEQEVLKEPVQAALASSRPAVRIYWEAESKSTRRRTRSVIVVPVILRETERAESVAVRTARQQERPLCTLYLELQSRRSSFDDLDQHKLEVLVDHVAVSLETARRAALESELRAAAKIQQQLLPADFSRWSCFDFHAHNIPTATVSGDFFEFVEISQHRLGIAVGDVSGHGLPAAVIMTGVMSSVWNNARNLGSPAAVLRCVNDYYAGRRQPIEKFTTLLYGELHSSGLFTWVNAGHIPPLIVRSNAQVEHFSSDTSVSPLGVNSSSSWSVGEPQESWVQLGPDDLVLIVTDGVTEAPAPGLCREQFGLERLAQAAASLGPERDPACLVESILAAIRAYTGKTSFPDDITLVAFRHRG